MSAAFELHPRLAADTAVLGDTQGVRVLLMNDARWPWLILVPTTPDLIELDHLDGEARAALFDLAAAFAARLRDGTGATKTNVASLGNQVPQLHVHVIARHAGDPAWPGPVWGVGVAEPYGAGLEARCEELRGVLGLA